MLWRTHLFAGATAGLLLTVSNPDPKAVAVSAGIAGVSALLPDIDSPESKLGRLIPILPTVLTVTVGHRGVLHSLVGALGMSLAASLLIKIWYASAFLEIFTLVLTGYITHLLLDSMTNSGCPWVYPIKTHIGIPLLSTGSFVERLIVSPVMIVLFAWLSGPFVWNYIKKLL